MWGFKHNSDTYILHVTLSIGSLNVWQSFKSLKYVTGLNYLFSDNPFHIHKPMFTILSP